MVITFPLVLLHCLDTAFAGGSKADLASLITPSSSYLSELDPDNTWSVHPNSSRELELCHKMVWSLHSCFYFTVLILHLQGGLWQTFHRSSFLHLLISMSLILTTPAACIQIQAQTLGERLNLFSRANAVDCTNADSQLYAHA